MKQDSYLNIARDEGVSELIADIQKYIAEQRKRHGPDPEFDLMIMGSFIAIIMKIAYAKKDTQMAQLMIKSLEMHQDMLVKSLS